MPATPASFVEQKGTAPETGGPATCASFEAFWPVYVSQHTRPGNRAWHLIGTSLALMCLCAVAWTRSLPWLAGALVSGYGCAWIGHFLVERNRPATFSHPFWSLRADVCMYGLMLTGRMRAEVERTLGRQAARGTTAGQPSQGATR